MTARELWKWAAIFAVAVAIIGVILGTTGALSRIGGTAVERVIFEQSYQKQAADDAALQRYRAELAAAQAHLHSLPSDSALRPGIEAQIAGLRLMLQMKEDN